VNVYKSQKLGDNSFAVSEYFSEYPNVKDKADKGIQATEMMENKSIQNGHSLNQNSFEALNKSESYEVISDKKDKSSSFEQI
jgi:hypothetical protein